MKRYAYHPSKKTYDIHGLKPNILYAPYCDCSSWVRDNTVSDTSPLVAGMYVEQLYQTAITGNTGLPLARDFSNSPVDVLFPRHVFCRI